jgi:hypothetical protein
MKNPLAAHTETDLFLTVCGLFVFAAAALWVVCFVPMNMDEAGLYHVLDCLAYPFAPLHTFRESCLQQNNLMTPLGLSIREPGFYTGIWPSILYAPFFFLFHAPGAQYAFGLIFLLTFAGLASRATAKPLLSFAVILSFFPFVYHFVHDTGPVKYAMLLFPLSGFFLKRILQTSGPVRYGYAVIGPLLLVCAVEEKPFFLYLLPSIVFFALALAGNEKNPGALHTALKKARGPLLVAAGVAIIGILLLLFSVNVHGSRYIWWLINLSDSKKLPPGDWLNAFSDFMLYWPFYAHYTYALADDYAGAVTLKLVTFGFFIASGAIAARAMARGFYPKQRLMLLGLSFASMAVIFLIVRNTWAGHHFVFLWAPLVFLLADLIALLTPGLAMGVAAGFFALNLWSVLALTQETPQARNSPERTAILHFFDEARASKAIINVSSWGDYYIQALYGPENQLVTYTEPYIQTPLPLTPADAQSLLLLAQKTGRTIYNVCYGPSCTKEALESVFGGTIKFEDALPGLPNWRVFVAAPR